MLTVIENLLAADPLNDFLSRWQQQSWQSGQTTAGGLAAQVKTNLQLPDDCSLAVSTRQHILQAVSQHPQFISAALPHRIFPPKFNCYRDGGHYGTHVDNALMYLPKSSDPMRTDLSATLFLTPPEDYDGGELLIETQYGAQSVKLNAGDMALYPSSSLHQVTPVTAGARVAAFFWIESLVRDDQQRAMLYDLDQSIQSLTMQDPESPNILRLTGVYHNLMRQWAQT